VKKTGLGGPFTPDTRGIFEQGLPPSGVFARGVFKADPPWSLLPYQKRYQVGLGGGLGDVTVSCGVDQMKGIIVTELMSVYPFNQISGGIQIDTPFGEAEISPNQMARDLLRKVLDDLGDPIIQGLINSATQGVAAAKQYFIQNISWKLSQAIKSATGIPIAAAALDNAMIQFAGNITNLIQVCKTKANWSLNTKTQCAAEGRAWTESPWKSPTGETLGFCTEKQAVPSTSLPLTLKPVQVMPNLAEAFCKLNPMHEACRKTLMPLPTPTQPPTKKSNLLPLLAIAGAAILATRFL
jgi:hypothetical protein